MLTSLLPIKTHWGFWSNRTGESTQHFRCGGALSISTVEEHSVSLLQVPVKLGGRLGQCLCLCLCLYLCLCVNEKCQVLRFSGQLQSWAFRLQVCLEECFLKRKYPSFAYSLLFTYRSLRLGWQNFRQRNYPNSACPNEIWFPMTTFILKEAVSPLIFPGHFEFSPYPIMVYPYHRFILDDSKFWSSYLLLLYIVIKFPLLNLYGN